MPETALQTRRLPCRRFYNAASAWRRVTSASDRQGIEAFVTGRAKRRGLCHTYQPPVSLLVEDADGKLFESMLTNPEHTL